MSKSFQKKKVYFNSYGNVFRACESALSKLKCNVVKLRENHFLAKAGFCSCLLGYTIDIIIINNSDGQIKVDISSKTGPLLMFGYPRGIINEIFKKIDHFLDYQEWQKKIYLQTNNK